MSKALPEMLDELERLARGAEAHSERIGDATWFSQRDIQSLLWAHPDDAAYIAAASPDAILRLVEIARRYDYLRKNAPDRDLWNDDSIDAALRETMGGGK